MQDCKSPGNDGLAKEFYEYFWNVLKDSLMNSIKEARKKKKLSISQKQAVIKLIEKKDRVKRYIKNWRLISLLNVDYKKTLATRLKETSGFNIMSAVCVCKKQVHRRRRKSLSDILEIINVFNLRGYKVTVDIEKAFDFLRNSFLLAFLKKFGFGHDFISGSRYYSKAKNFVLSIFNLQKGVHLGDPVSAYLFVLCLVKANHKVWGMNIFQYTYLYTAYACDTTSFENNSMRQVMEFFFSLFFSKTQL